MIISYRNIDVHQLRLLSKAQNIGKLMAFGSKFIAMRIFVNMVTMEPIIVSKSKLEGNEEQTLFEG